MYDLKYDGYRALLEIDDAGARLVSRNRNRYRHLDTLAAVRAKRLKVSDAILDGEVICADETGRPIFLEMLRGRHPVCFVAFDLLWLNGEDLRPRPLVERKKRLNRPLRRRSNHLIAEAMSVEGRGKALMAAVEEHDLEGIVAKRKADPYRRGVSWFKIKNRAYSRPMTGEANCATPDRRAIPAPMFRAARTTGVCPQCSCLGAMANGESLSLGESSRELSLASGAYLLRTAELIEGSREAVRSSRQLLEQTRPVEVTGIISHDRILSG